MQVEWWYATDGESRKGPTTADALRQLLVEGKVSLGTLVWREGMEQWLPLTDVPELGLLSKALPPDLPKTTDREHLVALPAAGPWRRFFARMIDIWLLAVAIAFPLGYALALLVPGFSAWVHQPGSDYLFGLILVPLALLLEVAIAAIAGNTPGKAILGITVTSVGASRLTARQYLDRQLGLYWYGLGLGVPIVSLFAMGRQYATVNAGGQTSYDMGKYNVKAPKLTALRAVLAGLAFCALFAFNIALQHDAAVTQHQVQIGFTWQNTDTGKSVDVPPGWHHETQTNEDGQTIHVFVDAGTGVNVIFAKETMPGDMDFDGYQKAWLSATAGTMKLSRAQMPATLDDRVVFTGVMVEDAKVGVHASLVQKGQDVWRAVILSTSGAEPEGMQAGQLRELLFASTQ